ncbi:MAG: hypothetical protein QE271_14790 [Bacteriovoracaceae bacterium]|nr:hypothetical protein [Bacteriovoracaceae bacterium]
MQNNSTPDRAIIAVTENELTNTLELAIERGIKSILIEKPGSFKMEDIKILLEKSKKVGGKIFIGYNRRFLSSVEKAKKIIAQDGGVTSFHFEFTEWGHVIAPLVKGEGVKEEWLYHNSSHIIDLSFYLAQGIPVKMTSVVGGKIDWHPAGSIFTGTGIIDNGAIFTYHSNWCAPGRWGIELMTKNHRLILRPVEKLQLQKIGEVKIEFVDIDDAIDKEHKPGYFKQVESFLNEDERQFCMLEEQDKMIKTYQSIKHGANN